MTTIAVIDLCYVGHPLVVEFCKKQKTVGFDMRNSKVIDVVDELKSYGSKVHDPVAESSSDAEHECGVSLTA